ncbi:MAG: glycosyltransferase family 39 protein [Planctomycetota bacterium]
MVPRSTLHDTADAKTLGSSKLLKLCVLLLAVHGALRLLLIFGFPIMYKEAYFWEWSRFLSAGYLEHPPLVAWIIATFQTVFPERSNFAIRGAALLMGAGSLWLIYRLALLLFQDRDIALRSLVIALSLPILDMVGVMMIPDSPLLFFHLLTLYFFAMAVNGLKSGTWVLFGLAMGMALLSKLMAVPALVGFALFLILSPSHRQWLRRKEPYLALLVAGLLFSPFLYWNAQQEWATFRLQLWDRHSYGFSLKNIGEFFFEQLTDTMFFMAVPVLGCLLVRSNKLREEWRWAYLFLKSQSLTMFLFFLLAGTVTDSHPHWTVLGYPTAAIALAALCSLRPPHLLTRGLGWWIGFSQVAMALIMTAAVVALPLLSRPVPERLGSFLGRGLAKAKRQFLGWSHLAGEIEATLAKGSSSEAPRIFTYGYRAASMLSLFSDGLPVVNIHAYWERSKRVGDAQWLYLPVEDLDGQGGILVTEKRWMTQEILLRIFDEVEELGAIEQRYGEDVIERFSVFRVEELNARRILKAYHQRRE